MIDDQLARHLIAAQFPQWKNLPIYLIADSGWDNRTFRLGEKMLIRMPSAAKYASQVEKEHYWLPKLAPSLPFSIPEPVAIGEPIDEYPWKWSIYRWVEGEVATAVHIENLCDFAADLTQFLTALQNLNPADGPLPGEHNFYRGGALMTYDNQTRQAISILKNRIRTKTATAVWETALATSWQHPPVWVHGDIAFGNLLVNEGRLSAVIDFGTLAVGDPACDLAVAWTLFKEKSRETFRAKLPLDSGTWARGRAWALWKALIIAAGLTQAHATEASQSLQIVEKILLDHEKFHS